MRLAKDYNKIYQEITTTFNTFVQPKVQLICNEKHKNIEAGNELLQGFSFKDIKTEVSIPDELNESKTDDYLAEYVFSRIPRMFEYCRELLAALYSFKAVCEKEEVKELISYVENNIYSENGKAHNDLAVFHLGLERMLDDINYLIGDLEIAFEEGDKFEHIVNVKMKAWGFDGTSKDFIKNNFSDKELARVLISSVNESLEKNIDYLLEHGANPFLANSYGRTAFSAAFNRGREDLAQKFLSYNDHNKLKALFNMDFKEGELAYYIANHISKKDDDLKEILFEGNKPAMRECYWDAVECTKSLGTYDDILIAGNDGI